MGAPFDIPHRAKSVQLLDTAAQARALHARRALVQAAEHGVALLEALGLPRLVTVGFFHSEPAAISDALDVVIAHLDALDAPAEDLEETGDAEPSLGWIAGICQGAFNNGDTADLELDMVDWEHSLGAPERHPYVFTMGSTHYEPGDGSYRLIRCFESQASWAQGTRLEGEREAEPGYDLACDEDELDDDGVSRGEHDTADVEPSIGWPNDFLAQVSPGRSECVDLEEAAHG